MANFRNNFRKPSTHKDKKTIMSSEKNSSSKKESQNYNKKTELNGPKGPEPTRFGDWEKNGRCSDF